MCTSLAEFLTYVALDHGKVRGARAYGNSGKKGLRYLALIANWHRPTTERSTDQNIADLQGGQTLVRVARFSKCVFLLCFKLASGSRTTVYVRLVRHYHRRVIKIFRRLLKHIIGLSSASRSLTRVPPTESYRRGCQCWLSEPRRDSQE